MFPTPFVKRFLNWNNRTSWPIGGEFFVSRPLCHDLGHLPFSHAAEAQLLPDGWDHERLSRAIIDSDEMKAIWDSMTPPIRSLDIVKLALGPRKLKDVPLTLWESILAEVIVGDSFGVDRIDYLLRDSYHAGVAYGRFDHYRLIDTMRILPSNQSETEQNSDIKPTLGVEEGGLHSAEALLLARYHMYSQVYFHVVRRIYDVHLQDFLAAWLTGGKFSTNLQDHLCITDNEVNAAISFASSDPSKPGHDPARRISRHEHFKLLYQRHPADVRINPDAGQLIFAAAKVNFGDAAVRYDRYTQKRSVNIFPVSSKDGRIASSVELSETLERLPVVAVEYVFIEPSKLNEAKRWLGQNRHELIQPTKEPS
jgi:uncharacterized protein